MVNMAATGANIKALMKQQGITPKNIQAVFGFDNVQTIYKWMAGKCIPNIDNLFMLADILGVTVDALVIRDHIQVKKTA